MVKLINAHGGVVYVAEERVEEYLAIGCKREAEKKEDKPKKTTKKK